MNQNKIDNFKKALMSLENATNEPIKNQRDIAGIIKNFEFVYELSWKLLKAYLSEQGIIATTPKDVFSKAYQVNLIENEKIWLEIINARNLSAHTYSQDLAEELTSNIKDVYLLEFRSLNAKF